MYYRLSIYSRFFSKSSQFFDICRESYKNFVKYEKKVVEKQVDVKREDFEKTFNQVFPLLSLMDEYYVKAVVFAGMCLEGFIYDYAATNVSDTYAKNYLDKLQLEAKYVVIPKIVTGKNFPTNSQAFEHLKALKKMRNDLVHYKSKRNPTDEELSKMLEESIEGTNKDKNKKRSYELNPYQTIIEILTELRKLDGDIEQRWWKLETVANRVDYLKQN